LKIRQADKVFFQFLEIFLNGQTEPVVEPDPRFGAFYRISLRLPRKKLKFFWGGNLGLSWPHIRDSAMGAGRPKSLTAFVTVIPSEARDLATGVRNRQRTQRD
jgi:hypothetical protein